MTVWLFRCGLSLLVLTGAAAAVARAAFPASLAGRMEPYRERLFRGLALEDPGALERAPEIRRFDAPFAAHPGVTRLHVIPGALFLALAPLQFSAGLRARRPWLHRWSGRLLLVAGAVMGVSGLYFGLLMPFAGPVEGVAIALFGGLFLFALARAFLAIRRSQVARHREWMLRAFALALAVSVVRVLGGLLDLTLAPIGIEPQTIFVLAVWSGWALALASVEAWIRRTRPAPTSIG